MKKGSSVPAHQAIGDLHQVGILNGVIRGCIVDPELETTDGHPNTSLFSEVEWYLTCRQIAKAINSLSDFDQKKPFP